MQDQSQCNNKPKVNSKSRKTRASFQYNFRPLKVTASNEKLYAKFNADMEHVMATDKKRRMQMCGVAITKKPTPKINHLDSSGETSVELSQRGSIDKLTKTSIDSNGAQLYELS